MAIRLYSGPGFTNYNKVLRGQMEKKYITTIHAIVSGIIKLASIMKLPLGRHVYRGLSGIELPKEFWDEVCRVSEVTMNYITTYMTSCMIFWYPTYVMYIHRTSMAHGEGWSLELCRRQRTRELPCNTVRTAVCPQFSRLKSGRYMYINVYIYVYRPHMYAYTCVWLLHNNLYDLEYIDEILTLLNLSKGGSRCRAQLDFGKM